MQNITDTTRHDFTLIAARAAMIECSERGIALGQWREDVLEMCGMIGLPAPDDVLAWVTGGFASDIDVPADGWDHAFSLS